MSIQSKQDASEPTASAPSAPGRWAHGPGRFRPGPAAHTLRACLRRTGSHGVRDLPLLHYVETAVR